jgi:phenylalanyl-tRNA synthetase beta chain
MIFTFNWLSEFVTVTMTPDKLAELLTMAGLEVESITPLIEPETNRADWLFTIGVTPNRGDCLGIKGIAREVAALTGADLKVAAARSRGNNPDSVDSRVKVSIEDARLCARYSVRILDEINIRPSPAWLRFRLEACGIRAINNVVDITNYVMLESGQPLHAFDFALLPARHIVVRTAGGDTRFTTLDGNERQLAAGDLIICDGDVPVALAGVMGGISSEVTQNTKSLLLESANFDAPTIRRTAKRLALHSEASHRFERGVDPEGTLDALDRAVALLGELSGAKPAPGIVDRYPGRAKPATIVLGEERIARLLGVRIDCQVAEKLLHSIAVETEPGAGKIIKCSPPASRPDLAREVDLIEELARLYGYDRIPSTLPRLRPAGATRDELLSRQRAIRAFLAGEGLVEVINLPFVSARLNHVFTGLWQGESRPVTVINPLVQENSEMRMSLIPGLVENLRANLAQKAAGYHAYHLGKVFRRAAAQTPEESLYLSGIIYGARTRYGLHDANQHFPEFLDCKGLVEGLFDLWRIGDQIAWSDAASGVLDPGSRALALVAEQPLGYVGRIHPDLCDEFGLPSFFVFELDLEKSLEYAPRKISVRNLPRFPSVARDFAVQVARDFESQQIVKWIKGLGEALIEHVEVFDEYRGAPIPEDKKSLAYKISYRAEDRTLTDAEINALQQHLVSEIGKVFGAEPRS